MDEQKVSKSNSNLVNLIAVGAFLWYFLKSLAYLVFISYKSVGIVINLNPNLLFWTNQILYILVMCIVLRIWLKKMWRNVLADTFQVKPLLLRLGLLIMLIQALQFLHGFYVSEYVFTNFGTSLTLYSEAVRLIDPFNLINTSFDILGTTLLLVLFIKWK